MGWKFKTSCGASPLEFSFDANAICPERLSSVFFIIQPLFEAPERIELTSPVTLNCTHCPKMPFVIFIVSVGVAKR